MQYCITIEGTRPIIMHNGTAGLDVRSPANIEKAEIAAKKGFNRTVVDEEKLRQLDCETSLWLDESLAPTIPPSAIRAVIESGARKLRQGPLVREGLVVVAVESFDYDRDRYGTTLEELSKTTQFTTAVVVQRSRILRTRARFDEWSSAFVVDVDDELVDQAKLDHWLDIGGRRIGLGDWRPERSGTFGRFEVVSIAIVV